MPTFIGVRYRSGCPQLVVAARA